MTAAKRNGDLGSTDGSVTRGFSECPKNTVFEARNCDEAAIRSRGMTVRPQIADESGPDRPNANRTGQGRTPKEGSRSIMTVDDVCAELGIARSTLYDWLAKGRAPRSIKLPNNQRRFRRVDFEAWLDGHTDEVVV